MSDNSAEVNALASAYLAEHGVTGEVTLIKNLLGWSYLLVAEDGTTYLGGIIPKGGGLRLYDLGCKGPRYESVRAGNPDAYGRAIGDELRQAAQTPQSPLYGAGFDLCQDRFTITITVTFDEVMAQRRETVLAAARQIAESYNRRMRLVSTETLFTMIVRDAGI